MVKATLMLDMMSKSEARNQKHETSPNDQNPKFKTKRKKDLVFEELDHLNFGFVSDFGFACSQQPLVYGCIK